MGSETTQFQKGESGNPAGRPKGSRNRLTETFFDDIMDDWAQHGLQVITVVRETNPAIYLKIISGLISKNEEKGGIEKPYFFSKEANELARQELEKIYAKIEAEYPA